MDLGKRIDEFIKSKQGSGLAEKTIRQYSDMLRFFKEWCQSQGYEGSDLDGVNGAETIEEYQQYRRERGLSAHTIHADYRAIRALYRWTAKRHGLEGPNPFDFLTQPPRGNLLPRRIPEGDYTRLLQSIHMGHWADRRDLLLLKLLYACGPRASEVARMKVTDIDLSARRLTLHRVKVKSEGLIPFPSSLRDELTDWLRQHRPPMPSGWLWPKMTGGFRPADEPLSEFGLSEMLKRRCERAGLPVWRPHSFRHACGSEIVQRGGSVKLVGEILGHLRIETSEKYLKFNVDEIARQYDRLFG